MTDHTLAEFVLVLAVVAVFYCVLLGWGRVVRRAIARDAPAEGSGSWAVTAVLGIGLLVSLGGVLNLVRMANLWALSAFAAIGLGLCVAPWIHQGLNRPLAELRTLPRSAIASRLVLMTIVLAVVVFTVATQLPPAMYNFGDDLQKYFAHPIRMLQTGTLLGSPLSAMGSESLGGMAFLQGFVAAYFPLIYLNGADAVLGLLLCLLLLAGFAWRRAALAPAAAVAMIALVAINPQYVNVSALYLGSALMMAAIFHTADPDEAGRRPSPLALGLIYAALVALKPTFLIFSGLHGLFMTLAMIRTADARSGLVWGALLIGWSLLFLAPWAALHAPHFVIALTNPVIGPEDEASLVIGLIDLFATRQLFYGTTFAHYSGAVVAAVLGVIAAWRHLGKQNRPMRRSAAATVAMALTCVLGYLLTLLVAGPLLAGYGTALRYFVPVIIAVLPAALCLAALHLAAGGSKRHGLTLGTLPLIAGLGVTGAFAPQLSDRIGQAMTSGSIHAFTKLAASPRYLEDVRRVLSPDMAQRIRVIQDRMPEGEPLLAWINAPFALDYARNRIIDVDIAGLTTPWARLEGARYVLWEYRGYGVRTARQYARQARGRGVHQRAMALRSFPLARYLQERSQTAELLYNDGAIALFRNAVPMSWP